MAGKRRKDRVTKKEYQSYTLDALHSDAKYYSKRGLHGEVGVISHELNRRRKDRIDSGMYPKSGPHY